MCVKGLPPVLMIHLKRFGFDWEAGRAIKSDDYFEASSVTIFSNRIFAQFCFDYI